jgi:putative addiction module component (TIGR02574 family)
MRTPELLLAEALDLPEADRAHLALRLSESLSAASNADAATAWAGEISRRIARIEDGTARTVSAEQALAEAHARLAVHRA